MARFVVHESVKLTRDFDADEAGYTPTPPVTVALDGGAPVAATVVSGAVYTADLGLVALGVHSATWAVAGADRAADTFEVVSDHLCSVADIRAGDTEFSDVSRFPAAKLRAARAYVNDEFDAITGRAFVRRVADLADVTDGSGFWLTGCRDAPALLSLTVDGVAADLSLYDVDDSGIVEGPAFDVAGSKIVARVEYGLRAVPEDVRRVAGIRARSVVAQAATGVPDRATSIVSPDGGQMTLATPGRAGYETGIPEVDAVLARYAWKITRDVMGML